MSVFKKSFQANKTNAKFVDQDNFTMKTCALAAYNHTRKSIVARITQGQDRW